MDETERRSVKRSRFDQTEPERKRHSRFDRRSRSPPRRDHHELPGRDRSPLQKHLPDEPKRSPVADPAAAAAAAAARINAQLQARKNPPPSDVLSIKSPTAAKPAGAKDGEMYISDGDFIKDIEINDLRNRYTLTKGAVQKMIKDDTGADVTTRGSYYPDKSMSSAANPPLYLHVTSTSKEGLDLAVKKIEDMMKQDLPQLVDERRFRRREVEPVEKDEYGRRKWPEEKIPINLEPVPGFNLRAQVVGHGGAYVKHIQHETGCRVQIKGRGSGFIETATQRESDEDMFLHVAGPDPNMVEKAKELCEDLLTNVKEEYESFKSRPPRPYGGHGGHHSGGHHGHEGGRGGHRERGSHSHGYNDRQQNSGPSSYQQHGYGGGGAGSGAGAGGDGGNSYTSSPAVGAAAAATASPTAPNAGQAATASDYAAQYAQYYGSDPYAAYGGYAAYVQMYQQYYGAAATQQQQQQAQQASPAPGNSASPPPPPNEAAPPPPPPPPPSAAAPPPPPGPPGAGSYNAVPPPPGL